jgi:hypothetical protein
MSFRQLPDLDFSISSKAKKCTYDGSLPLKGQGFYGFDADRLQSQSEYIYRRILISIYAVLMQGICRPSIYSICG